MNDKHLSLLIVLAIILPLVMLSCMSTPESAPETKPAATTPAAPVVEEKPVVNVPITSKQDQPVIQQFTIDPAIITAGGSATLTWNVTNATSVMIDHGVGSVPVSGTRKVNPTTSTIYKLTASNASGASAVKTVSIIVNAAGSGTKK